MSADPSDRGFPARDLWSIYDEALPAVYGYLLRRTGSVTTAEDLTSETVMAAIDSAERGTVASVTVPWMMGIARHKLVDHWRRLEREAARHARLVAEPDEPEDPWAVTIDRVLAQVVMSDLSAEHRAALTLRYLDALPVADVAGILDRTVHATESLLVRARAAFRTGFQRTAEEDR